jgi:hypothetical protein
LEIFIGSLTTLIVLCLMGVSFYAGTKYRQVGKSRSAVKFKPVGAAKKSKELTAEELEKLQAWDVGFRNLMSYDGMAHNEQKRS